MKVLYLADFDNQDVLNGGYGVAINNIKVCLEHLKKDKHIDTLKLIPFKKTKEISGQEFDYVFMIGNPNSFVKLQDFFTYHLKNCKNIYLHILWETDTFPSTWNWMWQSDLFTGFFAASKFLCNMLKEVTDKNIHYTPYCMLDFPEPINIESKEKEENFTVLFIGQITKRKGIDDAIISYVRAFQNIHNNESQLILKCFQLSKYEEDIENMITRLVSLNSYPANLNNLKIYRLDDNLDRDGIYDLIRKSSLLLFPSRGEGFGLPIMEAMSVGLPVMYTDWSASPEIANPLNLPNPNYAIDYILDESIDMMPYHYEVGSRYSVPLKTSVIEGLHIFYDRWKENKKEYYKYSSVNIDTIKKNFSLEKSIESYKKIIGV